MKKLLIILLINYSALLSQVQQSVLCGLPHIEFQKGSTYDNDLLPAKGTIRMLLILCKFKDDDFEKSPETDLWPATLNKMPEWGPSFLADSIGEDYKNPGISGYFKVMSNGQYNVIGDVVFYQPKQEQSYYYLSNNRHLGWLVEEILTGLDSVVDYGKYDFDKNGKVDMIEIGFRSANMDSMDVAENGYQGFAGLTGNTGMFSNSKSLILDGKIISAEPLGSGCVMKNIFDLNSGLSVLVHEYGHYLFGGVHFNGIGYHGLMDGMGTGVVSSFERQKLGWIKPILVLEDKVHQPINDALTTNEIYKISIPATNKYYLVENHQRKNFYESDWKRYNGGPLVSPGTGVLISYCSEDAIDIESAYGNWDWGKRWNLWSNTHNGGWLYEIPFTRMQENPFTGEDKLNLRQKCFDENNYLKVTNHPDFLGSQDDYFNIGYDSVFANWTNPSSGLRSGIMVSLKEKTGDIIFADIYLDHSSSDIKIPEGSIYVFDQSNKNLSGYSIVVNGSLLVRGSLTVNKDIIVNRTGEIVIDAGTTINFSDYSSLVVDGILKVSGTNDSNVDLNFSSLPPAGSGKLNGIILGSTSKGTINNCLIRNAAILNINGDLVLGGSSIIESNVTVNNESKLTISPGAQLIFNKGSTLVINGKILTGDSAENRSKIYFNRNYSDAENANRIIFNRSSYGKLSNIEIIALSSLITDGTLDFQGKLNISRKLLVNKNGQIKFQPGSELNFSDFSPLLVYGTLSANGLPDDSIHFNFIQKSNSELEHRNGIFSFDSARINLNYTNIFNAFSAIRCNNLKGSLIVSNSTIENNTYGVFLYNTSGSIIQYSTIKNNSQFGVLCYNHSSPYLFHNIIEKNGESGIYCFKGSDVRFRLPENPAGYNIITGNKIGLEAIYQSEPQIGFYPDYNGYNIFNNSFYDLKAEFTGRIPAQYNQWNGRLKLEEGSSISIEPKWNSLSAGPPDPANGYPLYNSADNGFDAALLYELSEKYPEAISQYNSLLNSKLDPASLKFAFRRLANCLYIVEKGNCLNSLRNINYPDEGVGIEYDKIISDLENRLYLDTYDYSSVLLNLDKIIKKYPDDKPLLISSSIDKAYIYLNFLNNKSKLKDILQELDWKYTGDELIDEFKKIIGIGDGLIEDPEVFIDKKTTEYKLIGNFPNPFNPSTKIQYALPEESVVELSIFDLLGRLVVDWFYNYQSSGYHSIRWNGTDKIGQYVCSGIYIYKIKFTSILSGKTFEKSAKMVLLK